MLSYKLQNKIRAIAVENKYRVNRRHKHFSFVCVRGCVLSVGFAQSAKTHSKAGRWFPFNSIHSEFDAMRRLNYRLPYGAYLVNVRLGANDNLMLSKPCPCCTRMLLDLGVTRVFYSTNKGDFREWLPKSLRKK